MVSDVSGGGFYVSEVGLLLEALVPASAMDTVKSMIRFAALHYLVIVAVFWQLIFFGGIAGL